MTSARFHFFLRGLLLGALAGWFVFYVVGVR